MALGTPVAHSTTASEWATTGDYGSSKTFVTGSFTPEDNSVLFLVVAIDSPNAPTSLPLDTLTDTAGLTWTLLKQLKHATTGWHSWVLVYAAAVTTGQAMTVSLANTSTAGEYINAYTVAAWSITDADIDDLLGDADATDNEMATDGADSLTLDTAPASDSIVFGVLFNTYGSADLVTSTPGTGWTELADVGIQNGGSSVQVQYRTGSTSTSVAWADVAAAGNVFVSCGLAFEVLEAAGAPAEVNPVPTVVQVVAGVASITGTAEVAPAATVVEARTTVAVVTGTAEVAPVAVVVEAITGTADVTGAATVTPTTAIVAAVATTADVTGAATVTPSPAVVDARTGAAALTGQADITPTPTVVAAVAGVANITTTSDVAATPTFVAAVTDVATITAAADITPTATVVAVVAGTADITGAAAIDAHPTFVAAIAGTAGITGEAVIHPVTAFVAAYAGVVVKVVIGRAQFSHGPLQRRYRHGRLATRFSHGDLVDRFDHGRLERS